MKLTAERIAEINKLPVFNGVVYGDVTEAELRAYWKIPVPPERQREIILGMRIEAKP